ncbi:MAG TPA: hypothetical protein VMI56_18975 [Reyranella sp.]|nr:hypothetical protein [Reyranella sp.]
MARDIFARVGLAGLLALALVSVRAQAQSTCSATDADLQALRDNLEIVRTEANGARDNFGPGRQKAVDAVAASVAALEGAVGHAIAPSPSSLILRTPGGRSHHPRMTLAQQALLAAHRSLDRSRCLMGDRAAAVDRAVAELDAAIADAAATNPPGGSE